MLSKAKLRNDRCPKGSAQSVMNRNLQNVLVAISSVRLLPHLALFTMADRDGLSHSDVKRWNEILQPDQPQPSPVQGFLRLMTFYPEFRNLFYYRMGLKGKILTPLCKPMSTLYIATPKIGRAFFIQHGFATIIAAREIGDDCWVNQQVTIGYSSKGGCPTLGNGVVVNAGAKVIGDIHIGANTIIGANAVVVKDAPEDATIVGIPGRVIKQGSLRVNDTSGHNS